MRWKKDSLHRLYICPVCGCKSKIQSQFCPDCGTEYDTSVQTDTLGQRIVAMRSERQVSRVALAKSVGVDYSVVFNWEQDRHSPKAEYIVAICKTLNVSADYLLGLKEKNDD